MCMIRLSPEKTSDSTPGEDPVDLGRILLLNVCIYFRIGTYDDFALPNKPLETCCSCMIWSLITEGGGSFQIGQHNILHFTSWFCIQMYISQFSGKIQYVPRGRFTPLWAGEGVVRMIIGSILSYWRWSPKTTLYICECKAARVPLHRPQSSEQLFWHLNLWNIHFEILVRSIRERILIFGDRFPALNPSCIRPTWSGSAFNMLSPSIIHR